MNEAFAHSGKAPRFVYAISCSDAAGKVKWQEQARNLVTTAGKTDLLAKYLTASGYNAAWYMGLAGTGTIAASDTLASHPGWAEIASYSGARPTVTFGTTAAGSNTAAAINFAMTGAATVGGAFIASAASGTSGVLYSAASFGAPRTVAAGDTLSITPTVSVS